MGIRSEREIYKVLEKHLRASSKAMTCNDLLDILEIKETAIAEFGKEQRRMSDQVSNALGLMWRNNLLTRYPAPAEANSLAKYCYAWKTEEYPKKVVSLPPSRLTTRKSGITIVEEDEGVRIEFEKFSIFIQPK